MSNLAYVAVWCVVGVASLTGCASFPSARDTAASSPAAAAAVSGDSQVLVLTIDPDVAAPGQDVDLVMVHRDGSQFEYGLSYDLERQNGDTWSPYDICQGTPCAFPDIAAVAEGQARQTISAPDETGVYRVTKSVSGLGTASAEFEVVDST